MAVFGSIQGAEPSTVTFEVRTAKITQNSTVMHQEIVSLGDPDTSNAVAAVLAAVPASTAWGLVTREAGGFLSSVGGVVVISGNSTVFPGAGSTWAVRPIQSSQGDLRITAYQSTAADFNVTAVQGTSPWVVSGASTVAPLAGSTWATRPIQTSQADLRMTAYQSTIADLNATVAPLAGSTWRTQPGSTSWASSAGFHFTSSGELQVAASFTGSTGPLTVSQLLDSSGGSVAMADSANQAIRANIVAGTVGFNLGTLQSSAAPAGNSSALIVRIAGGPSSAADCTIGVNILAPLGQQAMAASIPVVIASNQTVITAGGNKTNNNAAPGAANIPVLPAIANTAVPSYTDGNQVLLSCDTSGGLRMIHLDSSNATVKAGDSANNAVRVNVVAGAAGGSTVVTVSAFPAGLLSTVAPSSGSSGLIVRQVIDVLSAFASTSALASTTVEVQSSGANLRTYVTAYTITSTNQTPAHWGFFSSNGTLLWPITLAALSSATCGANLAVAPPGYLFRTAGASDALNFKTAGSTVAGVQLGVAYYRAP